ncbi:replication protein [Symbiopectobacterium purcellii]|uniref:Replication protein n=1 Tax=Symbiopectobacterium purcellii TaxID=2871826 RepID=A0ABX9ANN9_9ENTR|nr:replication protein [Symbiopectobacterium purcellii]QZN96363.1 replication protein [Symbiopectobacterium purcellii]
MVAPNLKLVHSSQEVTEHRVAQLEDGFLRLANDLLDATMCSGLPETELCIVMAVWRKTYGYSKKLDWISNEQLEVMIGKHFTHCSTAKNNLVRRKVLLQEGRKIGMNTNISEWETKNNGFCKTLAKPAKKSLAEVANRPLQKLLTTKDNIQKTINTNTPLPPTGESAKGEKPSKRKSDPINYDDYLNAYNEAVGDRLPHAVEANDERKRKLAALVKSLATPNLDGFRSYVRAFMAAARPFHFGDNDRGWVANFDYLLQRKTLTKIREGTL